MCYDRDSEIEKNDFTNVLQDVNHINFFDIKYSEIPNDDERVENDLNRDKKSQSDSSSSSVSGSNHNTVDFLVDNHRNDADSSGEFVPTQNEEVATLEENVFSEGNLDQNLSSSHGVQNVKRSSRQSVFPNNYNNFVVESKVKYGHEKYVGYSKLNSEIFCFVTQLNKTREPKSYFEASKYPHWTDAMNQEMDALLRNDKYKARLVAQGFGQKEGIDYEETFSLAVKMVTFRCLLNIVVSMSWHVYQLDVNNVFLYSDLERPDISYVVHCLSQFIHSHLTSHLRITFKILRYLKSCPGLGIHIAMISGMFLNVYSDADWAKCIVTRKSVTGYCVFLNNSLISWKSKKQNTLFKSSTEAKYRALASITSEVIWILKFLKDLQIENLLPVLLHCDSNSTIKIDVNHVFHERTKHLEINLHFVREKVLKGVVKTVKVDSANQIADILTKGLDTIKHFELVKRLGMHDVYQGETKEGY
ncbi:ribonuclease H-like domain-containing protein [Tanacetum coccineum]